MVTELQSEICENLSRYLKRDIPLQDFEDWFAPVLWEVAEEDRNDSRALAGSIANFIAQYSNGDLTEDLLRKELAAAILPFEKYEACNVPAHFLHT